MRESKLILQLKSLNKREIKAFSNFLHSPYHNNNSKPILLFEYLQKHHPVFEEKHIQQDKIFSVLYPNEVFNLNKFKKSVGLVSKLIEDYLVHESLKKNVTYKKKLLIEQYDRKNLYKFFQKESKHQIKQFHDTLEHSPNHYLELFSLYQNLYLHPNNQKIDSSTELLEVLMKQLDSFYTLAKLRYGCELIAREKIRNNNYQIELISEVKSLIEREKTDNSIVFKLYLKVYNLLSEFNENEFGEIVASFKNSLEVIAKEDIRILHQLLINGASNLINKGNHDLGETIFNLYQLGLKDGVLIRNNRMTDTSFTNIVTIGSTLGYFSWVQEFINHYSKHLYPAIKDMAISLANAYLFFNQKEYEKVIDIVQVEIFQNEITANEGYKIRIRSLQLRAHYENYLLNKNYYNILMAQILATDKYYSRNKIFANQKIVPYRNLCSTLKKLVTIQQEGINVKKKCQDLRLKAEGVPLVAKPWVLKKIDFVLQNR